MSANECICLPYCAGGDGPEEDCPVHGRMTADAARVTAWVEELAALLPEARRGFMEDRAPEAAGFLVDAAPALLAIVQGVAELAEEWAAEATSSATEQHARTNSSARRQRGYAAGLRNAAEQMRALLTAAAPGAEEERP